MKTRLARLSHHFIVCGFGRVGREVAQAIRRESAQLIVVDKSPQAIADAEDDGFLYIQGDATQDETLLSAGVERARGLVVAAGSDADNVFITLSAKGLNRDLAIVARATQMETENKLRRAGADRVVSPYTIGGRRMALSALRPLAVDLLDSMFTDDEHHGLRLAEVGAVGGSALAGSTVGGCCSARGVRILALKRRKGEMIVNPGDDVVIEPGDSLVIAGTDPQLAQFAGADGH